MITILAFICLLTYCISVISFQTSIMKSSKNSKIQMQVERLMVDLGESKLSSYVTSESNSISKSKPPIIFIHGSYHSGWCWKENFMEHFLDLGFVSTAISLRGTSESIYDKKASTVKIEEHIRDLNIYIDRITKQYTNYPKPVIISHSFGGLITQKLLESEDIRSKISGVCLLCSVPPSGNGPMTSRFIKSRFIDSLKIVYGFVFKGAASNKGICRELFFDDTVKDDDIERYMEYFKADSVISLDVASLGPVLPSVTSTDKSTGVATWLRTSSLQDNQSDVHVHVKRLVIGAEKDYIVDYEGVLETARYLNVDPVIISDVYHDVMLGPKWKKTADVIYEWLQSFEQL